jgi:AmmeMemoRadiSam system protein B
MMTEKTYRRIRPAAVAGQFYPGEASALRREIEAAFHSPSGPGGIPAVGEGPRRLVGVVAPHAGYMYSGAGAAWAYAAAARDGRPAAAVILGVNHYSYRTGTPLALSSADGWATPLGIVPVAQALAAELQELDVELAVDDGAHAREHSLEVQVPFLQYLYEDLPILPIAVGHAAPEAILRLGDALATLCRAHDLLLIASTDFSHQVPQAVAQAQDALALAQISAVDPLGLIDVVQARDISMCGYLPTAAVLAAARALGIHDGQVLHYHTSGDVTGDTRRVVGYGAAALYRATQ